MEASAVQAAKQALVDTLGLSKDALHIYVGLLVFFLVALVSRKPLQSKTPWLSVLAVALTGEVVDAFDELRTNGHWHTLDSMHDLVNTVVWPTALMLLARFTRVFGPRPQRVEP